MNRAERRRARRKSLKECVEHVSEGGVMQLAIIPAEYFFFPSPQSEFVSSVAAFTRQVVDGQRPLCLTCDHEWTDTSCAPPGGFAVVRRHGSFGKAGMLLGSGICAGCWEKRDTLMDRCTEAYRKIWPDLRSGNFVDPPAGVQ